MEIRRALVGDAALVAPLFDQYRIFYKQVSDVKSAEAFLKERLQKQESVLFLALDGDRVLGFTQLYPSFSSVSLRRLWILNDLFVDKNSRRSSVARALMSQAENFAREDGACGLTLKTARDNHPAQNLYTALGWKKDETFLTFNKFF